MSENLSHKQNLALDSLLTGASAQEAASTAGVTYRTIRRWLVSDTRFIGEMLNARGALRQQTINQLQQRADVALDTLRIVMQNSKSDMARVMAAREVLDRVLGRSEIDELQQQINTLQGIIDELPKQS